MSGEYTEQPWTRAELRKAIIMNAEPYGISKTQVLILEAVSRVAGLSRTCAGFPFSLSDVCDELPDLPPLTVGFELGQLVGRSNDFGDMFGRAEDGSWGVQVCHTTRSIRDCFVYIMDNGFHRKVGISNNPKKRRSTLSTASSLPIDVVYSIRETRSKCADIERRVHRAHSRERANGEWFTSPAHELIQSVRHAKHWPTWYDDNFVADIRAVTS